MSAIAAIITNTVTWFVQAHDRTKVRQKRDELDTLTEVWTGPSGYEDTFVPPVGRQHPTYNLMTVISTHVSRQVAGMTEIRIDYQGKLANGGADGYSSVPTVSKYWMEGEVTYQVNSSAGYSAVFQTTTGPLAWTYSQLGITSYARRYTGRCVELAYITNRVPSGKPSNIGLAQGFLGFQNVWDTMSGFQPGMQISGGGTIEQMTCTDVRIEDSADGWYHVTETYQSRMFPGPVGWEHPPPMLSTSVHVTDAPISNDTSDSSTNQNQNVITFNGATTQGAASAAAIAGGGTLPSSTPGSIAAQNFAETGMDSIWGTMSPTVVTNQTYEMASNAVSTGSSATTGVESTVYDG